MNRKYEIRWKAIAWMAIIAIANPSIAQESNPINPIALDTTVQDDVNIGFRRVNAGHVVGAITVVDAEAVNLRDNTSWTNNVLNGRTLGMLGSTNIRGLGININTAEITG